MYRDQAIEKLNKELKGFKSNDRYAKAVKTEVATTLKIFCQQDEEFAQAIVQTDKTLSDCCETIMKGTGNSVSDIEVYKKAVNFYFAGADIKVTMEIDLIGSAAESKPQGKVIKLSIDDLF